MLGSARRRARTIEGPRPSPAACRQMTWPRGLGSVEVVSYVEHLVDSRLLACTWEQATAAGYQQRVVPDACVDLIWSGERLRVAGPDTRARVVVLAPGSRLFGVRLRPGVAGAVLGLPASELCDISPDAADVLGGECAAALLEALNASQDPHALLRRAVARRGRRQPDPLVLAAVRALGRPRARVGVVAVELGLSARQLQRPSVVRSGTGRRCLRVCCAFGACRRSRRRRWPSWPSMPAMRIRLT